MAVPTQRKRYSILEYDRLIEAGTLREDDRVELIEGEIVRMAPLGLRHEACVRRLEYIFHRLLLGKVVVSTQNSIRIAPNSQPEPDVALLRWRDDLYADARPTPDDVWLVVEVADSSLAMDRSKKRILYGEAGIPEYWLINLQEDIIEIFSNPTGGVYRDAQIVSRGGVLGLPGDFGGTITADEVLGRQK